MSGGRVRRTITTVRGSGRPDGHWRPTRSAAPLIWVTGQPGPPSARCTGVMAVLRHPAGEDGSYDQFFDVCLPKVLNLARRLTGSPSQAEDIAIEALGRTFAHWERVREMDHAQAWVMRVTTNLVIGQARRRRTDPPIKSPETDMADAVALRLALVATMLKLPRRQREAVALRYLVDLPEVEVAAAMGVTAGSVKKHLSRGLVAMRAALGTDNERGDDLGFQ